MPTAIDPTKTSPGPGSCGSGTSTSSIAPTAFVTAASTSGCMQPQRLRAAQAFVPSVHRRLSGSEVACFAMGVLILSAGIGEGHDLPARWLAAGLAEEAPGVPVKIEDGLAAMGRIPEWIAMSGSAFHSRIGNVMFDIEHWLITRVPPLRSFVGWASVALGARG